MRSIRFISVCTATILLTACAETPMGPTVRSLPPQGKPFEQFQGENASCKEYADSQVRGQAEAANNTGLLEGIGGTILGAGLGAAIGGGRGAAIGAAGGAVAGTAVGASTSGQHQRSLQEQYNDAYVQCMTAKGNQVQQPVVYQRPARTTVIYEQAPPPPPTVIYEQAPPPPPRAYYVPGPPPPY